MGNAPPISEQKLKELRKKYDKDNNGLEWEEFKALAVEVGELQGLKKPVSEEKLKTIFLGLDEDKSGVVSIQEFEAAYAKLEEQLQAAAKAKAKSKAKAKADAKPKAAKAKAKAKAAEVTLAEGQTSIFDAMPGFNSFVRDLGISSLFEEDSRVPKAKAIPTPKKVKPPPLPEPQPPPLSSQVPWSTQLKAADPDWYDEDDAGYDSSDSFPEAGELPEEEVSATAAAPPTSTAPAALAAPGTAPAAKVAPVTPAAAPPKATEKPKAPAPKKAKAVKPKSPKAAAPKPKVVLREPKGRAQGVSAVDGVTDDVFSSPIHRREAVAHPQDAPDPQGIHVLQTGGGMEMIQQDPEVLSEPESQDSVDSISGEIARSWDPTATDVRYSYARDRAVGFSESWRPLKWSTEEWERRLLASGNLRHRVGIAKQKSDSKPKAPAPQAEVPQVEDLIAPEKPKVRSQYPLATEVKPKFIDVPLSGLQGVAAQGAVSTLRKSGKAPVAVPPAFEDPGDFDELYHSVPPPREPLRPGEPLVPLSSVGPPHLRESRPIPAAVPPKAAPVQAVPQFGQPWQPPSPLFTAKPAMPRPVMQEVRARPSPEEEGPDPPGRTWL